MKSGSNLVLGEVLGLNSWKPRPRGGQHHVVLWIARHSGFPAGRRQRRTVQFGDRTTELIFWENVAHLVGELLRRNGIGVRFAHAFQTLWVGSGKVGDAGLVEDAGGSEIRGLSSAFHATRNQPVLRHGNSDRCCEFYPSGVGWLELSPQALRARVNPAPAPRALVTTPSRRLIGFTPGQKRFAPRHCSCRSH